MRSAKEYAIWFLVILIASAVLAGNASTQKDSTQNDPWEPIKFFLGEWKGKGESFGNTSDVEHSYEFILQDKFIHSRTKAVFKPEKEGDTGEVHEDWGFFSFDSERGKIVFRQFLSEGFVNTYAMNEIGKDGKTLVFTSEHSESSGGMRARLKFEIMNRNEYKEVLELASPGKDFFICEKIHMKRTR